MTEKILFVDDDPNILSALQRQLRKNYSITIASSGKQALEVIKEDGPFAVVMSDMQMPEMDGVSFLKKVQEISPNSIRLMLTGNADQQTAINAVNEGNVFRFITKPCPVELLTKTIKASLEQYRLVNSEQELLQGTLNGSIKLLMDVLSIAVPSVFSDDLDMKMTATEVARALNVSSGWEMEMSTMLSRISYITLPPDTLAKINSAKPLSNEEQKIIERLPEIGHKLLINIPRLKGVAKIILYQNKNYDGSGFPSDAVSGEDIPLESRILKVLHDVIVLEEEKGIKSSEALDIMHEKIHVYDPRVLETVSWFFSDGESEIRMSSPVDIKVDELKANQMLVANVVTEEGKLLLTTGHQLTEAVVERLINYHKIEKIKEPIKVTIPLG